MTVRIAAMLALVVAAAFAIDTVAASRIGSVSDGSVRAFTTVAAEASGKSMT